MKIGVFVGSFDPVQNAHISIMKYLTTNNIVDHLLVIATGNYQGKQNITELDKRLAMLDLIKMDNVEINKKYNNYKYTYQILRELNKEYPNDKLYLVIGADNAIYINEWDNYDEIIKNGIIVIKRDNIKAKLNAPDVIYINKDFSNISSTKIRNNLNKYKSYLDKNVYNYIKDNNLYQKGSINHD